MTKPAFPVLRWGALLWCIVWIPSYWRTWGVANFLHVCDVGVLLTCIALWSGSSLLLSAQSVGAILPDAAWCLDAGWRLVLGRHLVGGTEYMWDSRYPLFVRLLSLFHVLTPVVLLWSLRRVRYDRHGWKLQSAILAVLLIISRLCDPALNLNYAFSDPIWHRAWGPPPAHVAVIFVAIVAIFYWPTHLFLAWIFTTARETESHI
ncbi:MAG TPA: hypothetical protein VOA41_10185 [Candidatus Dormibacteraeota bacterium]|nr:hypothetical protein [Candidatus Dormibacteraeota bacterium]